MQTEWTWDNDWQGGTGRLRDTLYSQWNTKNDFTEPCKWKKTQKTLTKADRQASRKINERDRNYERNQKRGTRTVTHSQTDTKGQRVFLNDSFLLSASSVEKCCFQDRCLETCNVLKVCCTCNIDDGYYNLKLYQVIYDHWGAEIVLSKLTIKPIYLYNW